MQIARIRSLDEYNSYRERNAVIFGQHHEKEQQLAIGKGNQFTVRGFSYPAKDMVDFLVDYQYSDGVNINWRERLVCPVTGLNNRLRGCIHLIDVELGLRPYHNIYIAEQVTPLYGYLKNKYPSITGSENLGKNYTPGTVNEKKIRHEDPACLSFSDASLDCYMSFECLGYVPDFNKAFAEAARVLKNGGKFLWSVPFANIEYENIVRAFIGDDGATYHIREPEYHANPVDSGQILCFTHFGWQMLDQVKSEGFKDAYAFLYRSEIFGYLGGEQILFIAEK